MEEMQSRPLYYKGKVLQESKDTMELIPRLLETTPELKTAPDSTPELTFELRGEAPPEGAPRQVG